MDAAVTAGTAPPPHLVTPPSLPAGVPFFDVTVDIDGIDGNDDGDTSTGAGALGSAAADVARSPVGSAVGGDDQADAPGTGDDVEAEKAAAVKAAAKREKELKKAVKDYMKTALSRYVSGESRLHCTKRATLFSSLKQARGANA